MAAQFSNKNPFWFIANQFRGMDVPKPKSARGSSESVRLGENDYGGREVDEMESLKSLLEGGGNPWVRLAIVHACVSLIARMAASCPVSVVRRDADGNIKPVHVGEHPLARLVRKPNEYQTPFEFFTSVFANLRARGNCYVYINRVDDMPRELLILDPEAVEIRLNSDWRKEYRYNAGNVSDSETWESGIPSFDIGPKSGGMGAVYGYFGPHTGGTRARPLPGKRGGNVILKDYEVIHIHDLSYDTLVGISPVDQFSRTFGLSAGLEKMTSKMVSTGGQLSGAFVSEDGNPGEARFEEARRQIENAPPWKQRTLVLGGKWEFEQTGGSMRDQELRAHRESLVSEIARLFGVPPSILGDNRNVSTSRGVEEQNRMFLQTTIMPLHLMVGQSLRQLISPGWYSREKTLEVIWDTSELTRAATMERGDFYRKMAETGVFSPNDIRRREKLEPREGGDEYARGLGGGPIVDGGMESGDKEDAGDEN